MRGARMVRAVAGIAMTALGMAMAATSAHPGPVAAQATDTTVVLVAHVSVDDPIGKTFGIMATPVTAPGTPPAAVSPVSGEVEVCGRASERGGRVLVMFDDDSAVVLRDSGCETVALTAAKRVTLQAQRAGAWDVIIRRAAAPDVETHLAAAVAARDPLGVNISLLTMPPAVMGELPTPASPYSGTVEVCVTAPADGGRLVVFVNDDRLMEFNNTGCQQVAVTDATSATLVCTNGTWSAVVRRLG